jgi:hypothetical protein
VSPHQDGLGCPLSQHQIQAASRLYERLEQWRLSDEALCRLHQAMPGFDSPEVCLLKAVAINELYGTNVFAIIPMSRHVHETLSRDDFAEQGIALVDRIAAFSHNGRKSTHISFASKFCHFFIDKKRFPIYDKAVRSAMELHLGCPSDATYAALIDNLQRLRRASKIHGSTQDVDRYLWIVGSYIHWKRDPKINAEVRQVFENPSPDERRDLDELLPTCLRR